MTLLRFAPYREIASEVAARLAAARDAWSAGVEVIVPTAGVAEAIARELVSRAGPVAGVRLQTIETFARRVLNDRGDYPRVAGGEERRLAMRLAVRGIDHPMMQSRGMAAMLERSYRDVRDGGLTIRDVERLRRDRTPLLIRAWTEYERNLVRLGTIDPADLLDRAARAIDEGATVPVQIVAGFYDMTDMQFGIIKSLQRRGLVESLYVPVDPEAYPFAKRFVESSGAEIPACLPSPGAGWKACTTRSYDTREDELRAVCAEVRALLDSGVEAKAIGIVTRSLDAYDARLIHRFAGFPIDHAEETPLLATRVGRAVATMLRLRDRGYPRGDVIAVLRDGFRSERRVDVDALDQETRRARIAGGTSESLRPRAKSRAIDDYIAVVAELESLARADLGTLLAHVRLENERDLAAASEIDDVAALFRRAPRFEIADVLDALEQRTLSPAPAEGVWLGDVLRFRGRSFEHLFAVRMQDDLFPQRRIEDALIPDADRRALGLREIGNGREEERLLFQLVQDAAGEVRFSYASSDGFGKVLRGSVFFRNAAFQAAGPPASSRRRQDAGGSAGRMPALRSLQLIAKSGTASVFDGYLGNAFRDRIATALRKISPTQLEDFGECPQKFLFKHILGVFDIDDPERELQINHRDKGTIDHRILERVYRSGAQLEEIVDEEFDRLEIDAPPVNRMFRDIERRATKRNLRTFMESDRADLELQGLTPKWFEYTFGAKYQSEPFRIDAGGVAINVEGKIDRIDTDGRAFRIVDYKSGKANRHKDLANKIDRGVRLQLALYAMAVAKFFGVDARNVRGAIKPLVLGETKPAKFEFVLAERESTLRDTLSLFVRAMLDGAFPAFPNDRDEDFNSCKYCPVNHSCRTKHDAEERYAVQAKKDPRTLLEALP